MDMNTKVVHGGQHPDPVTGAVASPIYQTSTFAFKDVDHGARLFRKEEEGYIYTRLGNPTINLLASKLALLESTEAGHIFSSGSAAIYGAIVSLVGSGNNVVSDDTIYGGTYAQFLKVLPKVGIDVTFVDTTSPEKLENAIKSNTKLVFIETPANPTLKITDIAKCAEIAHQHEIPLAVDNTFATPCLQRPIELGADISIHSLTKYLGGHGDSIGGVVVGREDIMKELKGLTDLGACINPFGAWLILRGLKTLAIRMERHSQNAAEVVEFLESHPKVDRVYYPGLPSHPGHEIAKRQMSDFGGMVSFEVKGGREAGKTLMNSVKLCILAVSLGDTDTLIEHPASMTHSAYSDEECLKVGITPGFVRISVGIESAKDIIADVEQALARI
jgi:methionine-gamma-lyase